MKQRTLARAVSIQGTGLHTGNPVTLTFKPAPADHGIVFKRMDLAGQPEVKPSIELIGDLVRNTTVQDGHTKIHLVEHAPSAAARWTTCSLKSTPPNRPSWTVPPSPS
jgi:UDP-3-O-[3-hydroxymyristoyl] N-acetylglucosamine deacetylase / 3-hydroxyacyl-[acyl-carrier-protein] dehydratase